MGRQTVGYTPHKLLYFSFVIFFYILLQNTDRTGVCFTVLNINTVLFVRVAWSSKGGRDNHVAQGLLRQDQDHMKHHQRQRLRPQEHYYICVFVSGDIILTRVPGAGPSPLALMRP